MKKIMFNDKYGLTQAVLEGRKTMTRRIITDYYSAYRCGEVLAIAQSYASIHQELMNGHYADSKYDAYRCASVANTKGWKNKMFVRADLMPYHIQITDIKIERLQDITGDDIAKEGVWLNEKIDRYMVGDKGFFLAKEAFEYLIDKVSKKGTWQINPYVFVYSFELIEYK